MNSDHTKRGHVFIVWGGNQELALLVASRLAQKGIHAEAGGDGNASSIFLGQSIFNQMKRAAAVVILVQIRNDAASNIRQLSQNLMIEWGFAARHVGSETLLLPILIGAAVELIPSDFKGVWAKELAEPTNLDQCAEEISKHVYEKITEIGKKKEFTPGNLLRNWRDERYKIESFLRQDKELLECSARQLIGALFVPLSSNNETTLIQLLRADVTIKSFGHFPEYRLLSQALQYEAATKLEKTEAQAAFSGIYKGLVSIRDYQLIDSWSVLQKYNFMGLTMRKMARFCLSDSDKSAYRDKSRCHYYDAIKILENVIAEDRASELCQNIWRSFLLRNLGIIEKESNRKEAAIEALSAAKSARSDVYSELLGLNTLDGSAVNALFELTLAEMDLAEVTDKPSYPDVTQTLARAEIHLRSNAGSVARVIEQIKRMESKLPPDLKTNLDRFSIFM